MNTDLISSFHGAGDMVAISEFSTICQWASMRIHQSSMITTNNDTLMRKVITRKKFMNCEASTHKSNGNEMWRCLATHDLYWWTLFSYLNVWSSVIWTVKKPPIFLKCDFLLTTTHKKSNLATLIIIDAWTSDEWHRIYIQSFCLCLARLQCNDTSHFVRLSWEYSKWLPSYADRWMHMHLVW